MKQNTKESFFSYNGLEHVINVKAKKSDMPCILGQAKKAGKRGFKISGAGLY